MDNRMRRYRVELPEGEIAGYEYGDPAQDLAALFLHANGFNALTYQSILAPLGVRTRVGAMDLRGHGRTVLPTDPGKLKSWNVFRDDVIALLEKRAPKGTVLAGHSLGAIVALLVAGKRPDLVRALLLVEPVILDPGRYRAAYLMPGAISAGKATLSFSRDARKRRARFESEEAAVAHLKNAGIFKTWREPFVADYVHDGVVKADGSDDYTLACDPAWEAAIYAAQRHRPWHALRRTRCQVTILRAAQGSTLPDMVMRKVLARRPLTTIETVRGTTHSLPMETPYEVREALSAFISQHFEGFTPGEEGPVKRSLNE